MLGVTFLLLAQKKSNQKKKAPRTLRASPLPTALPPRIPRLAPRCSWTPSRNPSLLSTLVGKGFSKVPVFSASLCLCG